MTDTDRLTDALEACAELRRDLHRVLDAADRLATAAEQLASSEPDMPSHETTVDEFDAALDAWINLRARTED